MNAGPLNGSPAWCGDPQSGLRSLVDFNAFAGSDVQIRFRMVTDNSVGRAEDWTVDDVAITGCGNDLIYTNSFE